MMQSGERETRAYTEAQRESADYIAELLLGLRKAAKRNDLPFLVHLIEMAFFEAYTVAKEVEPDMSALDRGSDEGNEMTALAGGPAGEFEL
jgi:hypothetical protein